MIKISVLTFLYFPCLLASLISGIGKPRSAISLYAAAFNGGKGALEGLESELLSLYESFKALLPRGIAEAFSEAEGGDGIAELMKAIFSPAGEYFSESIVSLALFISAAIVFSLGELFISSSASEVSAAARAALASVLSLPMLSALFSLAEICGKGLKEGSDFFAGLIPIMTSIIAAAGGTSSTAVAGAGMSLSLAFVSELLAKNLYPIFGLILALSVISNLDSAQSTGQLAKSVKGIFTFLIGVASLVIGGTLALQTTVTAASDSLALRGVKYAVSGMIPVVGGAVSGALSTLVSGVKLLSGTIGSLSVAALATLMGAPLVMLIVYRAALSVSGAICSYLGASFGEKLFSSFRAAVDCLIAIVASSLLLFALLLAVFVKTAGGVMGV